MRKEEEREKKKKLWRYGETEILAKFNYMIYFLFYYCATTLLYQVSILVLLD